MKHLATLNLATLALITLLASACGQFTATRNALSTNPNALVSAPLSIIEMFNQILANGVEKGKADLTNAIAKAHAAGDKDGEQCWSSGLTWLSGQSFESGPPAVGPVGLWEDARLVRMRLKAGLIPEQVRRDCAMVRLDAIDTLTQPIPLFGH